MSTDHEAEYADNHGTYGIPFDVRLVLSFARVPLAIAKVPTAVREAAAASAHGGACARRLASEWAMMIKT